MFFKLKVSFLMQVYSEPKLKGFDSVSHFFFLKINSYSVLDVFEPLFTAGGIVRAVSHV
jgi:hypothetical protein